MLLDKNILNNTIVLCNDKHRQHLQAVGFDYNEEKKQLSIVATNAQVMIATILDIESEDDQSFCKKCFLGNKGYFIQANILKKEKSPFCVLEERGGQLLIDGQEIKALDGRYVNWRAILPKNELKLATAYCGFDKDLVKLADRAWGLKSGTIIERRPFVNADTPKEHEGIHYWINRSKTDKKILAIMPMRID